jgi:hypothetical protein
MILGTLTTFFSDSVYVEWYLYYVRKKSKDTIASGLAFDVGRFALQNEIYICSK